MTTRTKLTTDDLQRTLDDERHLGFGYACSRDIESASKVERLDRAVVAVANDLDLDYERLFEWSNSKYGRWLTDDVLGCDAPASRETVRKHLNARALVVLAEGR